MTFETAQPEIRKVQKEFPKNYIGSFYNIENNKEISINRQTIIDKYIVFDTLRISDLTKNEFIRNDTLYSIDSDTRYKIKVLNDSLFTDIVFFQKIIFDIKKNDILKKYKGDYFLNKFNEEKKSWDVKKINVNKGVLRINKIESENGIHLLETIMQTKIDSTSGFIINPSGEQFKEFISRNGFNHEVKYIKREFN